MYRPWDPANRFQLDALRSDVDQRNEFADAAGQGVAEQVGRLLRICEAQRQEIGQLRLGQQLLMQMLTERGVIDFAELQTRYRATEQAAQPSPEPAQTPPGQATVQCASCGNQVDRRNTYVTGRGTVCDACHGA